jgi:predicted DNA-binding protein with PD1-like motif
MVARVLEGEDLLEAIKRRAEEAEIKAGCFFAIGSLSKARIGYYRDGKYDYRVLSGPLEIASCTGNIGLDEEGKTVVHSHIVVSDEQFETFGGHLTEQSTVGATAELVFVEAVGMDLRRSQDKKTGLKLLRLG